MKSRIKVFCLIMCVFMIGTALFACGQGDDDGSGAQKLRIFTYTGNEYDAINMDAVMKRIENHLNIRLAFEGAPTIDYYTKLSAMIGSGNIPDIIWSDPETSGGAFQTWSDPAQDLLWNLDDLLNGKSSRYPYLTKLIYSNQYKNIMYHNGHYIVPYVNTPTAWAIYYRADWLEAIGYVDGEGNARPPVTLDEFEDVMKKFSGTDLFTNADGSKSGRTYGISPNTAHFYVNPLYGAFGITPDWDITESGEVTYMYTNPEFKNYLKWMNAMYANGWIDPTFNQNVGFTDRDVWYSGKVGCIMTNGEAHMEWVVGHFEREQGEGRVIVGPPPEGTGNLSTLTNCVLGKKGEKGYSNWGGYYGGYAVTKDCKDPYLALDFLEYMVSPEGAALRLYGIEGQHYSIVEGRFVADIDGRSSERYNYFGMVTLKDNSSVCGGLHRIGSLFGYAVDWDHFDETGEIAIATDIGSLYPKYRELVSAALESTRYLQTSRLLNVTAFPSTINTKKVEVMDIAQTFVNKAIIGTVNLTTDWDNMITQCNNAGYGVVKSVIKETAQSLGIIN